MNDGFTATGELKVKLLTTHDWDQKLAATKKSGERLASELLEENRRMDVQIIAPRELPGADPKATPEENSTRLAAACLDIDWKTETRREMAELARDFLAKAFVVGALDPSLPPVLAAMVEGRGLFEHGIGEFFLLYGRFEERHGTSKRATKLKMDPLVNGDPALMKPYWSGGKWSDHPLPYAVRNILAHAGTNPNKLDERELRRSIELLRRWLGNG